MQYPAVAVSFVLFGLFSSTAHALGTEEVSQQTLQAYGATLDASAGNSQWQQLWKRTRDQGMFSYQSPTHFTIPNNLIPDMVRRTLSGSQSVKPMNTTQAMYRFDFDRPVGVERNQPVNAICLIVDWRTLPADTAIDDVSRMSSVSLLMAHPCA
ncbi:hypothetical protein ALQ47_03526 [Pseudomonas cichorii]|uniref:hypothetical protein n=1 Tax=Pseudomonas capsici TaxID=2810614 RepID=UPI000EFDF433|nr:hypothetical protein [Pseudomonas capsici]MCV4265279.1 hypothetical protein [Pseudomonas capsici]RMO14206.1 hypothetical protein ALQ47_03526 [Pseudomonas cichorii]